MNYNAVVIGKGLIGSAAAAYLAQARPAWRIALIGPDEPAPGQHALVYASHYDAARIQRLIGKDTTWTRLNLESVQAYPALEQETGIRFHRPAGCLYVSPHGPDAYLERLEEDEAAFGLRFTPFSSSSELARALPQYRFPEGSAAMLEEAPAGMIFSRPLVEAQVARFRSRGGSVVAQTVIRREAVPGGHRLHLEDGTQVTAERVLVAAGSFSNFNGLLPRPIDISVKGEYVLLAEVSEEVAHRYADLPALLYELFHPEIDGIYLTQPLRYPDGRWYVKMGCNVCEDRYFTTLQEVQVWFRTDLGDSEAILSRLKDALHNLLPGLECLAYRLHHCIIHRTPSLRQYIGQAGEPGLFVVAGCNGYSAMCSDALGRLSAHMLLHGTLPDPYDDALFRPQWVC